MLLPLRDGRQQAHAFQTRHRHKDGEESPVQVFLQHFDAEGAEPYFLAVARDLSTLRQADAALVASEAKYRRIVETAQEGVWMIDEHDRTVLVNRSMGAMLGYAEHEMMGRSMYDFMNPAAVTLAQQNVERRRRGVEEQHDFELLRKDGEVVSVTMATNPVFDAQHRYQGALAMVTDVTARRKAEKATQESERRLANLIANLPGYVYQVANDAAYTPQYISEGVVQVTGYAQHEYLTERTISCGAELHEEDRERIQRLVDDAVGQHEQYECEYRIWTKSGELKWVWERGGGKYSPTGELEFLEGFVTDITSRVRAQAEREELEASLQHSQKMDLVGQLAGGVAHDFNNLLTIINGHAELGLELLGDPAAVRHDLTEIRKAGEQAAVLTRQLLSMSRKQIFVPEQVCLNAVVHEMTKMLDRVLRENIDLVVSIPAADLSVRAGRGHLEQIIMNLTINARDAMPEGGTLSIDLQALDLDHESTAGYPGLTPGAYVRLRFSDTGVGMDDQTRSRIFEPFFTTKEHGRGTGLGLSTVEAIVTQLGGAISVDTAPGRGTTFGIVLPMAAQGAGIATAPPNGPARGGTETILIVDYEEAIVRVASRILRSAGYNVLTSNSGEAALQMLGDTDGPLHLLLTDVVMPGMSGPELAARILKIRPRTSVVFMSGHADDAVLRHETFNGTARFVSKPFASDELRRQVRETLPAPQDVPATG